MQKHIFFENMNHLTCIKLNKNFYTYQIKKEAYNEKATTIFPSQFFV